MYQANLCGSSLGLYFSYHVERYYRHRREVFTISQKAGTQLIDIHFQIARLYQPLSASISDLEDDYDEIDATQLLPTHTSKPASKGRSFANIWDEQEELFEIGDSDEEDDRAIGLSTTVPQTEGPRIVVSQYS